MLYHLNSNFLTTVVLLSPAFAFPFANNNVIKGKNLVIECSDNAQLMAAMLSGLPYMCGEYIKSSPGRETHIEYSNLKTRRAQPSLTITEVVPLPLPRVNQISQKSPWDKWGLGAPLSLIKTAPLKNTAYNVVNRNWRPCGPGEFYLSEVGICIEETPRTAAIEYLPAGDDPDVLVPLPFTSSGGLSSGTQCPPHLVFASEVGLCLPSNPSFSLNSQPVPSLKLGGRCPANTVYNIDVDLCLPYIKPKAPQVSKSKLKPASASQIKSEPEKSKKIVKKEADSDYISSTKPTPITLKPIKKGWNKCPEGQVYVSEIDLCVEL